MTATTTQRFELRPSGGRYLAATLAPGELGLTPRRIWNPSPSNHHRTEPYDVPQKLRIDTRGFEETGAKYSPPPYAVVVEGDDRKALLAVAADAGWHLWNYSEWSADGRGAKVRLDLEGHSDARKAAKHVGVCVVPAAPGESNYDLLARGLRELYPQASRGRMRTPDWWHRPIYCGWGDQVTASMWMSGVGPEPRAVGWCIQGLYERWLRRLDEAGVPIGTVTIDAGWSPGGVWEPEKARWPDLKGFIARQHQAGRKVLLWLATWLYEGLPAEWCVRADGEPVVADPTHPKYRAFIREKVTNLISRRGYDADGFKIDQNAYVPTERVMWGGEQFGRIRRVRNKKPLRAHGKGWGCEMLHLLQKTIYDAAHDAKRDALVSSSTVHPYFHDTLDMVRIHDMGHVAPDIFAAMKARVDLAHAALPGKVIDADDWIHSDYEMWLRYTSGSHVLGVPCLFYAERFMKDWHREPATVEVPLEDLKRIAAAWRQAGY